MQLPHCPKCDSTYTYEDNGMYICPECAHEWNPAEATEESDVLIVKDANGNLLADGDSVTVVKDLKVKGSSSMLKIGTKVKNIRLVEGDHNIDCKIDGFGPMKLKSEFVKRTDLFPGGRRHYFPAPPSPLPISSCPTRSLCNLLFSASVPAIFTDHFAAMPLHIFALPSGSTASPATTLYGLRSLRYSPCP